MQGLILGVSGPFSGPRAAFGELLMMTCQNWIFDGNVVTIFLDDNSNPVRARSVAEEFVERGVGAVVGHFNSECAKVAGAVYAEARTPLLLPASTLPSLTENQFLYRLCANDAKQIDAIALALGENADGRIGMWSDGSEYGNRLKRLLASAIPGIVDLNRPAASLERVRLTVCLGAYHSVADLIGSIQMRQPDMEFLCSDDCAIAAFAQTVTSTNVRVAIPTPSFRRCVQTALELVQEFLLSGAADLNQWLQRAGSFKDRELLDAGFTIKRSEALLHQ